MFELWIVLSIFSVFLMGFWLGRKLGLKEGLKNGLQRAPLEIKRRSLETGECIICGITKKIQDIAGKL